MATLSRALAAAAILLGSLLAPPAGADAPALMVLLSERSPAYVEVADAVRADLDRNGAGQTPLQVGSDPAALARPPGKLLITVGSSALQAALAADLRVPILATLLPRAAFEHIAEQAGKRGSRQLSAVFLDQPIGRQFDLLRVALPDSRRIGVVFGPESHSLAGAMAAAAEDRGQSLVAGRASGPEDLYRALQQLVGDADLLLAEPDPAIYNGATIQNILLTTYRAQIPLIGFSPAYVKAGALLALYTTPSQIGTQAGDIARAVLAGRNLPPPQPPRDFTIASNAHVARSLGLSLDEPGALADRVRQLERRP